jgi:hypothetical protein
VKIAKSIIVILATILGMLSCTCPAQGQHLNFIGNPDFGYALSDSGSKFAGERLRNLPSITNPAVQQFRWASPFLLHASDHYLTSGEQYTFDLRPEERRIKNKRAWLLGTANAGVVFYGFKQAIAAWGESKGKFHFKDDWEGDHLAQIDEMSHFLWGYKMTQLIFWSYRWAGFSSKASQIISVSQSAFILTLVEYPVDAYNPEQGLGVSDLVFDYAGIGLAFLKQRYSWFEDVDVKISSRKNLFLGNQPVFAQTYEEFDNFIYWLTYRVNLSLPQKAFCFGMGYGVTHQQGKPKREFLAGIGLSLPDFLSLFHEDLGQRLRFLEIYYPNLSIRF